MRSILFYLLILPVAVLLVVFGVINRDPVTVILDPFSPDDPTLAFTTPLYFLVFAAIIFGIVIGGLADWVRQGRWRKAARENRYQAERWRKEAAALKEAEPTPVKRRGEPAPSSAGALPSPHTVSGPAAR